MNWFYDFTQVTRYTLRQLRNEPGFAVLAILTLALGIGANTAMFAVTDSVLIRPLPFRDTERMVAVEATYGSNAAKLHLTGRRQGLYCSGLLCQLGNIKVEKRKTRLHFMQVLRPTRAAQFLIGRTPIEGKEQNQCGLE